MKSLLCKVSRSTIKKEVFSAARYFFRMYREVMGLEPVEPKEALLLGIHKTFCEIKREYRISDKEVIGLATYALYINPQKLHRSQYSNPRRITNIVGQYDKWKLENVDSITEHGLVEAIKITASKGDDTDSLIRDLMDE